MPNRKTCILIRLTDILIISSSLIYLQRNEFLLYGTCIEFYSHWYAQCVHYGKYLAMPDFLKCFKKKKKWKKQYIIKYLNRSTIRANFFFYYFIIMSKQTFNNNNSSRVKSWPTRSMKLCVPNSKTCYKIPITDTGGFFFF